MSALGRLGDDRCRSTLAARVRQAVGEIRRRVDRLKPVVAARAAGVVVGLLLLAAPGAARAQDDGGGRPDPRASIIQVLAYRGDELLNQGSGVVVAPGLAATSAHLLHRADRVTVLGADGVEQVAVISEQDDERDVATLTVHLEAGAPITIATVDPPRGEQLRAFGYWADEEATQASPLGNRPRFRAARQDMLRTAEGVAQNVSGGALNFIMAASPGRGVYGGAIVNRCGELVGLARSSPGSDITDLWRAHTPGPAMVAVSRVSLEDTLEGQTSSLVHATVACLTAAQAEDEAERQAQEAEEERLRREEAEEEAEEERQRREDAEERAEESDRDAEEAREAAAAAAEGLAEEIQERDDALAIFSEQNRQLLMALAATAAGTALVVIIAMVLLGRRRRALQSTQKELAQASARFNDCMLEGRDANNAALAIRVPGRDLVQNGAGLTVGRHPDQVDVVIPDDTVSRRHAQLSVKDGRLHIQDLGSTGGTSINGTAVGGDPQPLLDGDALKLGGVTLKLSILR